MNFECRPTCSSASSASVLIHGSEGMSQVLVYAATLVNSSFFRTSFYAFDFLKFLGFQFSSGFQSRKTVHKIMTQKLTKNISYMIHPFATSCRSIAMCGLYHKHNLLD